MATELAIADDGSWQISLADITVDGPLTGFAGRHRLLTIVDGPVLGLEVDGESHVVEPELGRTSVLPLAADQAAYVLKGDEAGGLVTGPAEVSGRCTLAVITLQRT